MNELQRFKTEINLTEFAASRSYELDRRQSSRSSATMRHPDGDKVIISKSTGGDWIYFSVRNGRDNGSIIDFLQNRDGGTLGNVRKTLRAWFGSERPHVSPRNYTPSLIPIDKDRGAVLRDYERAAYQLNIPCLSARGLDHEVMRLERFVGRFKMDQRSNALFPHYDRDGLCGFEIKNQGFTGFASGGLKGLWYSLCRVSDKALVLSESAIDGISYHILNPNPDTRYMSTGGAMNPQQPALIRSAMERMPKEAAVVLAFDNDKGGEKLTEEVKALAPTHITIQRPLPPIGKDWNDTLKAK